MVLNYKIKITHVLEFLFTYGRGMRCMKRAEYCLYEQKVLRFHGIMIKGCARREIVNGFRLANEERAIINPSEKSAKKIVHWWYFCCYSFKWLTREGNSTILVPYVLIHAYIDGPSFPFLVSNFHRYKSLIEAGNLKTCTNWKQVRFCSFKYSWRKLLSSCYLMWSIIFVAYRNLWNNLCVRLTNKYVETMNSLLNRKDFAVIGRVLYIRVHLLMLSFHVNFRTKATGKYRQHKKLNNNYYQLK